MSRPVFTVNRFRIEIEVAIACVNDVNRIAGIDAPPPFTLPGRTARRIIVSYGDVNCGTLVVLKVDLDNSLATYLFLNLFATGVVAIFPAVFSAATSVEPGAAARSALPSASATTKPLTVSFVNPRDAAPQRWRAPLQWQAGQRYSR